MGRSESSSARRVPAVGLALLGLLALPLVVALVALHSPRWYPIGDLAQTELRVREVGTAATPLVGLAGRIGPPEDPGHHPGPAGFYALTPGYRVLGSTPFALQVATAALSLLAVALSLWIAHRRGGRLLALGVAAGLAVLVRSLGPRVLTEPWNPYLPVLWWVVVLLAVWSAWCDDDALLPVAVAAACLASQTHVPYAALVAVVLGATALRLVWRAARRRPVAWRWVGLAAAVGVVAWIPPVVDELTEEPGNLTVLYRYFLASEGEPVGLRAGFDLWLSRLDPWTLVTGSLDGPTVGNRALGAAFLALWAAAAVVAWRRRDTVLLRLHQVAGLAALAGLVSMTRIYGALHYYLVLWAWSTLTVALVAVVATAARAVRVEHLRSAVAAPAAVLLLAVGVGTVQAAGATQSSSVYSETLGELVGPTVAALDEGQAYEVRADDPYVIGVQGYGMFTELRRAGVDARLPAHQRSTAGDHVVAEGEVLPLVVVATGPRVAVWRARPGAVEVASADPRSPAERREQAALIARVQDDLRALGRPDQAAQVEQNLLVLAVDGDLPSDLRQALSDIVDLGAPTAVFVVPPTTP